jgi:hypothetical protein
MLSGMLQCELAAVRLRYLSHMRRILLPLYGKNGVYAVQTCAEKNGTLGIQYVSYGVHAKFAFCIFSAEVYVHRNRYIRQERRKLSFFGVAPSF